MRRVAVVGVGAVGAMCLWQLASRGVAAVGYDRYAPGHDRGASGGESRIFRVAYKEGSDYVPLLLEARELWQALEKQTGQRLLHRVGAVTVGPESDPDVQAVLACAKDSDLTLEALSPTDAAVRVPEHPLFDGETMLLDPLGGLLRPEASIVAAAARAEALGASIHRYSPVLEVHDDGDSATVVSEAGAERYDHVVVAPGPWARHLEVCSGLPLETRLITAIWFPRRDETMFALDHTPVAIRVGPATAFSCFPSVDGVGVKMVPHEGFPAIEGPEAMHRSASLEKVKSAAASARRALPGLVPDPVRVGTYCDMFTQDGHGVLGPAGRLSAVTMAIGFSGHGFKMAPSLGRIAADRAIGQPTDIPELLSPTRS